MKFIKNTLILLAFAIGFTEVGAQAPDWTVNSVDFNYSMSYVGIVYVDYELQTDPNGMLAAFVGDELRGVTSPVYDDYTQNYSFYLLVYSNEDGQQLNFKYYSSITEKVTEFDETDTFIADAIASSPFEPTVWSQADPNAQAELPAVNAFTPNGDGVNDAWFIKNVEVYDGFQLHIFNPAGKVVYQTNHYLNEWEGTYNGSQLPTGTYYYLFKKENTVFKGTISLVR